MNIVKSIFKREENGLRLKANYDSALKHLKCYAVCDFSSSSRVYACRFCKVENSQQLLALANEDGEISLQKIDTGKGNLSISGVPAHHNAIFDLAWVENDFKLVSVSGDHTAVLWDVSKSPFEKIMNFLGHTRSIKTISFKPQDSAVFATGARDGMIMVWDTRCAKGQLQIQPDNYIINGHNSAGSKARKRKLIPTSHASSVTNLLFQDQDNLISCGAGDGMIKVWDMRKNYSAYRRDPVPKHTLQHPKPTSRNGFSNLILDPAGVRLYGNCMDDVIYCYNVASYDEKPIASYSGHQNNSFYIKSCLSPNGQYLVSGSGDDRAYIWNVENPSQPIAYLSGHDAEVICVAWCPVGDTRIVTCSDDGYHRIWQCGPFFGNNDMFRGWAEDARVAVTKNVEDVQCNGNSFPQSVSLGTPRTSRMREWSQNETPENSERNLQSSSVEDSKSSHCMVCQGVKHAVTPCTDCVIKSEAWRIHRRLKCNATKRKLDMSQGEDEGETVKQQHDSDSIHHGTRRLLGSMQETVTNPNENEFAGQDNAAPKRSCQTAQTGFLSPTMNLPNYVLDGTSPHHCCNRNKRFKENVDWLTKLRKMKKSNVSSSVQTYRKTHQKRTQSSNMCNRSQSVVHTDTLLRYFGVSTGDKK